MPRGVDRDLVAPGTAYLWQYLMKHPILERFGRRFSRPENQPIQTRLINSQHILSAARGVDNFDTLFTLGQSTQSVAVVGNFKSRTYIRANPPGKAFTVYMDTQGISSE